MIYHLALSCLAPVLIAQGRYVRRMTPVLPLPDGDITGVSGDGPPLRLLIVGDSAAAGIGVTRQSDALSGRLVNRLARSYRVHWHLHAQSGDRSVDLLHKLKQMPAESFDVAVISIGVNDVVKMTLLNAWCDNLTAIADTLGSRFSVQRVLFSSVPPMHLFPALPNPLRWWMGLRAKQLNETMQTVVSAREGCEFLHIPYSGNPQDIAVDGFHPGAGAYAQWAKHLCERIERK